MPASPLKERPTCQPTRFRTPTITVERVELKEPRLRLAHHSITSDEEIAFVKKAVFWMLLLSVTPLTLFLIVNYFHPDLFLTPIVPNQAGVTP